MRQTLVACVVTLCCAISGLASAEVEDSSKGNPAVALLQAVNHVRAISAKIDAGDTGSASDLRRDVDTFTVLIDSKLLSPAGLGIAHYYRAEALDQQNFVNTKNGQPPDAGSARLALADFDYVIDKKFEQPPVGIFLSNAEYRAGQVAQNSLHDSAKAYAYWKSCAEREHAGCMNIMADAKLTGADGAQDIGQALEYHSMVYKTGIKYTCAGAFSALEIAEIVYFTGVKRSDDDPTLWLNRAYALLDELAEKHRQQYCNRSEFQVVEFLMDLGQGNRRQDILNSASEHAEDPFVRAVTQFIAGSIDDSAFQTRLAPISSEYDRCHAHFYAMWHSAIVGSRKLAEEHWKSMSQIGPNFCGPELVFAKKFGFSQ